MTASKLKVQVAWRQESAQVQRRPLVDAVRRVLRGEAVERADISIAVVDDAEMRELNRRYLNHDYPTDVLSFLLEEGPPLEGELILSAETASRAAAEHGWSVAEELLLYAIHGTLHLTGHDDATASLRSAMRQQELSYLAPFQANSAANRSRSSTSARASSTKRQE